MLLAVLVATITRFDSLAVAIVEEYGLGTGNFYTPLFSEHSIDSTQFSSM
jgi:hypothetical protein